VLGAGLTRERAADISWFYLGHDAWNLLAVVGRWSWDDAEQWLTRQLTAALLGPR